MANKKFTDLSELLGSDVAGGDLLCIVDVSDTTGDANGTSKSLTADSAKEAFSYVIDKGSDRYAIPGSLNVGTDGIANGAVHARSIATSTPVGIFSGTNSQTADLLQANDIDKNATLGNRFRVEVDGTITQNSDTGGSYTVNFENDETGTFKSTTVAAIKSVSGQGNNARFLAMVPSGSDGDPYLWLNRGSKDWSIGADSSDNFNFKIGRGSTPGSNVDFEVNATNGKISMYNLPTSAVGLSSGDLWNDSGTVKIA